MLHGIPYDLNWFGSVEYKSDWMLLMGREGCALQIRSFLRNLRDFYWGTKSEHLRYVPNQRATTTLMCFFFA